ncbi:hypothetical protein HID58_014635, partial [Brassica napus]
WPIFNEPEPLSKYTASESSPSLRLQDHRSDFCNPTASIEQLYTTSIQQIALQRAQKNSKELDVVPLQWPIIGKNSNSSSPEFEQFEKGLICVESRGICGLAARDNLRGSKKEFNKTEDDLKSLQSVGQIIGEVLRPLDNERLIVKASSGPRYVVGCRSKVDKEKLISATRVVLDMTTLTIMRALPREAFTQHLSIYVGDAEEVSQHYKLMSRHTRDCLGVSFRCYAYISVSG